MTWYTLELSLESDQGIADAWAAAWKSAYAGAPIELGNAVFRTKTRRRKSTLFFSPQSQVLAQTVGAIPCPKPIPTGLVLLAGHRQAWSFHFADAPAVRAHFPVQTRAPEAFSKTHPLPLDKFDTTFPTALR